MFKLYPASFKLALEVADRLREEDVRELETATGVSAQEAVFRSLAASAATWVAYWKGQPHSIFGVSDDPKDDDKGLIWMVGTPLIEKTPIATYKSASSFIEGLFFGYDELWNLYDTRNTLHGKWLKALGATFGPVVLVNDAPFQYFYFTKRDT